MHPAAVKFLLRPSVCHSKLKERPPPLQKKSKRSGVAANVGDLLNPLGEEGASNDSIHKSSL